MDPAKYQLHPSSAMLSAQRSVKLLHALIAVALSVVCYTALAQQPTKGVHRIPLQATTKQGQAIDLYKQSHALLIGVSDYNNGWSRLPSIPRELDQVARVLRRQNFNIVRIDNPDHRQLRNGIVEFINNYGFEPDNRLVFFFSGHGHSENEKGFLLPTDAPLPENRFDFRRRALSMNQFMTWARDLEAKHAIFLFDSCFSGSVFKTKSRPSAAERYIRRATERPVRQFITAGSADELVPAKSTFTPALVDALKGKGDLNNDGYITGSELGLHLQQQVPLFVDQTPQYGKIRDYHLAQGDVVFFTDNDASVPATTEKPVDREILLWQSAAQGNTAAEYRAYLNRFPDGIFNEIAHARIKQLEQTVATSSLPAELQPVVQPIEDPPQPPQAEQEPEQPPPVSTWGKLTVEVEPPDARVRIMNIVPRYYDEIDLELNAEYDILVTKDGYESWQQDILMTEANQIISVSLKRSTPSQGGTKSQSGTTPTTRSQANVIFTESRTLTFEPAMITIPAGEFMMGSPSSESRRDNDERHHQVQIESFKLSQFETTFDEYDEFARATGRRYPGDSHWGRGKRPVIKVSWWDATAYAEWLSEQTGKRYRLPTEAEWEYAARAGSTTAFHTGKKITRSQANFTSVTVPVGSFAANAWGLHDMHGNALEWTCSAYDKNYLGAEQRCEQGQTKIDRVLRSGRLTSRYKPENNRSATRYTLKPSKIRKLVGFRLAQDR